MKKVILPILLFLCVLSNSSAQQLYELKYTISCADFDENLLSKVGINIPNNYPLRQEVLTCTLDNETASLSESGLDLLLAFDTKDLKRNDTFEVSCLVLSNDINSVVERGTEQDDFYTRPASEYLGEGVRFSVSNTQVLRTVAALVGHTDEETLANIVSFVTDDIRLKNEYSYMEATRVLESGEGSVSEKCDLIVTLCRAAGLPARVITGFHADLSGENHHWVEVFLAGWRPYEMNPNLAPDGYIYTMVESDYSSGGSANDRKGFARTQVRTKGKSGKPIASEPPSTEDMNKILVGHQVQNVSQSLFDLAMKQYFENKQDALLITLDSLRNININSFDYLYLRSLSLIRSGQVEDALINIQYAMKVADGELERNKGIYLFANYYAKTGEGEKALGYLEKVVPVLEREKSSLHLETNFEKIAKEERFLALKK